MFKESFEEGISPLEKASSVDSDAVAVAVAVAYSDATFTGREGSFIKEVILCFYNMTKYIILYHF
jgi:tellurite resistance protein